MWPVTRTISVVIQQVSAYCTLVSRVIGSLKMRNRAKELSTPGFHTLSTVPLVSETVYRWDQPSQRNFFAMGLDQMF